MKDDPSRYNRIYDVTLTYYRAEWTNASFFFKLYFRQIFTEDTFFFIRSGELIIRFLRVEE